VTSYSDTAGVAFIEPAGIDSAQRGELRTRCNGTPGWLGKPSIDWIFGWLTFKQWEYAKDNWEGLVTVKTALNSSTFANYNAVLRVEDPAQMTEALIQTSTYSGLAFINAPFHLTGLVAL
jgi:hypothetical protein